MAVQTSPRQIYAKDKRVRLAVDLVAAMAAFGGGHFFKLKEPHIKPETWAVQTAQTELEKIARELVIDGNSQADLQIDGDRIQLVYLPEGDHPTGTLVKYPLLGAAEIQTRVRSPLENATTQYDSMALFDKAILKQPELARHRPHPVEVRLGFPVFALSQAGIDATPAEEMLQKLWYTPHDAPDIRHFIRACIVDALLQIDEPALDWEWNVELYEGPKKLCHFGEMYQVFKRFGLDISKLREYEQAGIQAWVDRGFYPRSYLDACMASYGE